MNFSKAWGWGSFPPHHYGCVLGTHNQCWFCHFNFKSLPDVFLKNCSFWKCLICLFSKVQNSCHHLHRCIMNLWPVCIRLGEKPNLFCHQTLRVLSKYTYFWSNGAENRWCTGPMKPDGGPCGRTWKRLICVMKFREKGPEVGINWICPCCSLPEVQTTAVSGKEQAGARVTRKRDSHL